MLRDNLAFALELTVNVKEGIKRKITRLENIFNWGGSELKKMCERSGMSTVGKSKVVKDSFASISLQNCSFTLTESLYRNNNNYSTWEFARTGFRRGRNYKTGKF